MASVLGAEKMDALSGVSLNKCVEALSREDKVKLLFHLLPRGGESDEWVTIFEWAHDLKKGKDKALDSIRGSEMRGNLYRQEFYDALEQATAFKTVQNLQTKEHTFSVSKLWLYEAVDPTFLPRQLMQMAVQMDKFSPPGVYLMRDDLKMSTVLDAQEELHALLSDSTDGAFDDADEFFPRSSKATFEKNRHTHFSNHHDFFFNPRCVLNPDDDANRDGVGPFAPENVRAPALRSADYVLSANSTYGQGRGREHCDNPTCFRCRGPGERFRRKAQSTPDPIRKNMFVSLAQVMDENTKSRNKVYGASHAESFEQVYRTRCRSHEHFGVDAFMADPYPSSGRAGAHAGRKYPDHALAVELERFLNE